MHNYFSIGMKLHGVEEMKNDVGIVNKAAEKTDSQLTNKKMYD